MNLVPDDHADKLVEEFNKRDILHVDATELSNYAINRLIQRWGYFKRFFSVNHHKGILWFLQEAPKTDSSIHIEVVLINYLQCTFDLCLELRKVKKLFPRLKIIMYNFKHSEFEKIHLLKAGVNALLPPECKINELKETVAVVKPDSVLQNRLIGQKLMDRIEKKIINEIADLTFQEIATIRDIVNGLTHADIASKHFRSESRINNISSHIHLVTGCTTPIDFVRFALLYKIVDWNSVYTSYMEQETLEESSFIRF